MIDTLDICLNAISNSEQCSISFPCSSGFLTGELNWLSLSKYLTENSGELCLIPQWVNV